MGFDAGSITGHLKITRDEFDADVEELKAEQPDLEESLALVVDARIDQELFDADAAELEAKKGAVEEPGILVPAKIDNEELAASAAVSEAILQGVRDSELGSGGAPLLQLGAGDIVDEGVVVQNVLDEIGQSLDELGPQALVASLLAAGTTMDELVPALRGLGLGAGEAASLASQASAAEALVAAILPSPEAIGIAGQAQLEAGMYQLVNAGGDPLNYLYSILGGERTLAGGPFTALGPGGEQLALPSGLGNIAIGPDGLQAALGPGEAEAIAQQLWGPARFAPGLEGGPNPFMPYGLGGSSAGVFLTDAAISPFADARLLESLGPQVGAADYLANAAGGGGGGLASFFNLFQDGGPFSGLTDIINKIPLVAGGINGLATLTPVLGALGTALGGIIAGTSIGTAGAAWAFIPGLLDLMKGYEAYTTIKGGTATAIAKLTPGATSVAGALGGIIGSGSSLFGKLETEINPQIVHFLTAFATALQTVAPFAQTAVTAMGGFFTTIDRGMQSAGFKSFMATMTADLGPIMKDFGTTIIHIGTAFGNFLSLFGGGPAQMVGNWFAEETTKLSSFLAHATISPSFLDGAKTAFTELGQIIDGVFGVIKDVASALAPIGLGILQFLGPAFSGLATALNLVPTNVLTAIALGLGAIAIASSPLATAAVLIMGVFYAINWLTGIKTPAITFNQLKTAAQHALTPVTKLTAKLKTLYTRFSKHGIPKATIAPIYNAEQPVKGPTGYTSPITSVQFGHTATALHIKHLQQEASKLTPVPTGGHGLAAWLVRYIDDPLIETYHNLVNWTNDTASAIIRFFETSVPNAFNHFENFWIRGWGDVEGVGVTVWQWIDNNVIHPIANFFTTKIPDAFNHFLNFWKQAWGDVEGAGVTAWQAVDNNVIHPFVHFFTTDIPHAFEAVPGFFVSMWGGIEGAGVTAWHAIYNNVLKPIADFFTKTIPHAFTVVLTFFKSLPTKIAHAAGSMGGALLGAGKSLVNGLITGLDTAINWVNNHIPSLFGVKLMPSIPDIPKLATGGPFSPGLHLVGETGPELVKFGASGTVVPNRTLAGFGQSGAGRGLTIYVDARGATDVNATRSAANRGINQALPMLRAALERGAA